MGEHEEELRKYREEKQDMTKNLPKDWEKQLQEDQTQKDFDVLQKKEDRHTEFRKERDAIKTEREKEKKAEADKAKKEADARAAKLEKAEREAERIKRNQYDAEKAQEFKEIRKKNDAIKRLTDDEQSAMLRAKSGTERIQIRQRIEARQRAENERIEAANRGVSGQLLGNRLITPVTIKESVRKSVSNTPAVADRVITNLFGNTVEKMTRPTTPQISKQQTIFYKGEMKQMSKVVNRRKITAGPVKQIMIVRPNDIMANPDFMSAMLGEQPLVTQVAKNKKANKSGSLLDKFVSSL